MLKTGDIVEIFEDPLTMMTKEGNAEIVEHVMELEPGVNLYYVHFVGDDPRTIVERKIAEAPICSGTDPVHCDNPQCRVHWVGGGQ